MARLDLLLIGPNGNTHVAGSLSRAAQELGLSVRLIDTAPAYQGNLLLRAAVWRFGGRRPLKIAEFSRNVGTVVAAERPRVLMTIGQVPIVAEILAAARTQGVRCVHWSTDDPWNLAQYAGWHLRNLRLYDLIFTPRRSNLGDFQSLGCSNVIWTPFGYDATIFETPTVLPGWGAKDEVLFVGGADKDRAEFFSDFIRRGPPLKLVGGYWARLPKFRDVSLGQKNAAELAVLTAATAVNLCLVRRANRDGHVMRSFEIPAVGGFMLAEDTEEHREFFGPEGECTLYFADPIQAAAKARWAIEHPVERRRMALVARQRVCSGGHTYKDRLKFMLEAAGA